MPPGVRAADRSRDLAHALNAMCRDLQQMVEASGFGQRAFVNITKRHYQEFRDEVAAKWPRFKLGKRPPATLGGAPQPLLAAYDEEKTPHDDEQLSDSPVMSLEEVIGRKL